MMSEVVLAIETTTDACSVALWVAGEGRELLQIVPNQHSTVLLSMIDEIFSSAQLDIHQCDAIAFGEGPGSFTGVRIGIGVAQGLAFSAGIPMVPVSSLQALAERQGKANSLVAFDARQGEVYWCIYEHVSGSTRPFQPVVVSKPALIALDPSLTWLGVGSGCDKYSEAILKANPMTNQMYFTKNCNPHALDIGRIARKRFSVGKTVPPEKISPCYVRNNVATKSARK